MGEKEEKKKEQKEKIEVITAIYKVNLHCQQCWREIKKPLARTQGIQSVEVDMEKNEVRVKGSNLDVLKIHKQIEKLSKKKVELISPKVKPKEKETPKPTDKPKQILIHRTITAKVHLHCPKCGQDLKNKLLKHKGIYSVKTDIKAQTLTIEGTIEPEKFRTYLKKKLHKHVDITADKKSVDSSKPSTEKKNESIEKEKSKEKSSTVKKNESIEKEKPSTEKKNESIEKEKPKEKLPSETTTTKEKPPSETTITKIAGIQTKEKDSSNNNNVPYFIHYVYAPQLFSDENPNACRVM